MTEIKYYTFPIIKTELNNKGIEKKIPKNMPNWKDITTDNYKDYINPAHQCRANLTGIISGITVIDYDDMTSYNRMLEEYPDLIKYKTIKTKKGVHIYCQYDESIKTTTNASEEYVGIDIRNDSAVVFAPPTRYKMLDGTMVHYTDMGGEILPIPDIIRNNLKQNKKIEVKKRVIIKKEENQLQLVEAVEITEVIAVNIEIQKYNDYTGLIDIKIFEDYENYFKFQRASSNLGIPFEIFDEIVKQDGAGNYDKDKNKKKYEEPHNGAKDKLGWRFIFNLAKNSNPKEKEELDAKYRKIKKYGKKKVKHGAARILIK